jgi:hypothetical protein
MNVDGKCHCGRISYTAIVDPAKVSVCHCTDCQMFTGSAYRVSVHVPKEQFALRSGAPAIYVKTAASGAKRAQAFCADCGTPVYSSAASEPTTYSLRIGCLSQRADLPPKRRIWCDSAVGWSQDLQTLPSSGRQ